MYRVRARGRLHKIEIQFAEGNISLKVKKLERKWEDKEKE